MLNLPQITTNEQDEKFFKTVANNIKRIRTQKGLSQLETALGIGHATNAFYANMENYTAKKHFNLLHLYKLSKLFECDICEFFRDCEKI
ncbi:helix-turn-helix domain-containing protein [Campylobacter sp. VBCF_05 NA6]|uniref:helix-turn-helix transcriptional regulator n=1 Tax=unclassified Campylobacter TaxID=2593542 RepID=UPI0022E9F76C|nr:MULTISPECIES: helix-turn-helix transcriptional regulator [unclassified Campylobacter]MDA3058151.1 helix-turn-helix domain-containing protein [Campylobacter sp. VBCF_04 NA7]MDA3059722.1 helix-turn-helix domain-containing protein [Campylobacter sp. VBCF_05 NA6]